jgi:hypothetical protein
MEHRPAPAELHRKESSILIVGRHDRAEPLELLEVGGGGERDQRPTDGESSIGDGVVAGLLEPGDARILDAPDLFRIAVGIAGEGRLRIDPPVGDAVLLRATVRCEWPRRSSTRMRSKVSPSMSVAPALKTVLAGYGRSLAVRIGLAG